MAPRPNFSRWEMLNSSTSTTRPPSPNCPSISVIHRRISTFGLGFLGTYGFRPRFIFQAQKQTPKYKSAHTVATIAEAPEPQAYGGEGLDNHPRRRLQKQTDQQQKIALGDVGVVQQATRGDCALLSATSAVLASSPGRHLVPTGIVSCSFSFFDLFDPFMN